VNQVAKQFRTLGRTTDDESGKVHAIYMGVEAPCSGKQIHHTVELDPSEADQLCKHCFRWRMSPWDEEVEGFSKRQNAAIAELRRVLEEFALLDLSVFVTGDVNVRRGPIEMTDTGLVKQDDVEWETIITSGLNIDGGGW